MRRDMLALAAALAVQVVLVAAIPLHETLVRMTGRTVVIAVEPFDPYDPVRGYHADFTYPGFDRTLPGFDHEAADGSPALVVLQPTRAEEGVRPVRIVRSLADSRGAVVLRARYVLYGECRRGADVSACRFLHVTPDVWYADEGTFNTMGGFLRQHLAVAELRVTPDGDASLLRLRASGAGMVPVAPPLFQLRPSPPGMGPKR